jgi:hypothetical protein
VREIRKQFILVVRIAINRSYIFNEVKKKTATVIEGQKWTEKAPTGLAKMLTSGTRVRMIGQIKQLDYKARDGKHIREKIISFDKVYIITRNPKDLVKKDEPEEEPLTEEEQEENQQEQEYDYEDDDIFNSPLY